MLPKWETQSNIIYQCLSHILHCCFDIFLFSGTDRDTLSPFLFLRKHTFMLNVLPPPSLPPLSAPLHYTLWGPGNVRSGLGGGGGGHLLAGALQGPGGHPFLSNGWSPNESSSHPSPLVQSVGSFVFLGLITSHPLSGEQVSHFRWVSDLGESVCLAWAGLGLVSQMARNGCPCWI